MSNYQEVLPMKREEAESVFRCGTPEAIAFTLVRLAYHDPDWIWVQDACIRLSAHDDKWVRRTCATCFGHIARIHGRIEIEKVAPVLERLLADPEVMGEAEDALADLEVFLK